MDEMQARYYGKSKSKSNAGKRELQGRRPGPLKISKESNKCMHRVLRKPVIIYLRSPEVIHTEPKNFMALVQRLTGKDSSSKEEEEDSNGVKSSNTALNPSLYDNDQNNFVFSLEQPKVPYQILPYTTPPPKLCASSDHLQLCEDFSPCWRSTAFAEQKFELDLISDAELFSSQQDCLFAELQSFNYFDEHCELSSFDRRSQSCE